MTVLCVQDVVGGVVATKTRKSRQGHVVEDSEKKVVVTLIHSLLAILLL